MFMRIFQVQSAQLASIMILSLVLVVQPDAPLVQVHPSVIVVLLTTPWTEASALLLPFNPRTLVPNLIWETLWTTFCKMMELKQLTKCQLGGKSFLSFATWSTLMNFGSISITKENMVLLWLTFSHLFKDSKTKNGIFFRKKPQMLFSSILEQAERLSLKLLTLN